MSKRIVRESEAFQRLGCKRSKFRRDFVLRDRRKPHVPDTQIKRLKPVYIGVRNIGFLDSEIDALITALAAQTKRPVKRKQAATQPSAQVCAPT